MVEEINMRVESPTSLKTFQQCPYKYRAQYITKELKWVQSDAAARGDALHKLMEKACDSMWDTSGWADESQEVHDVAFSFYQAIYKLKLNGWLVETELETATDGLGNVTGWSNDDRSWLRSKIDVCATHPDKDYAIIVDWKTGQIYDEDRIQLDVNAMCLKPITGLSNYKVMFAYLDQNVIKNYDVTVDIDNPREFDLLRDAGTKLIDTMIVLDRLRDYTARDFWPKQKNKFCRWCGIKNCKGK